MHSIVGIGWTYANKTETEPANLKQIASMGFPLLEQLNRPDTVEH